MLWRERATTGEVQAVGQVARIGGRSVGCSGDRARVRLAMIRGPERVVDSGEVRVVGWSNGGLGAWA